MGKTTEEEAATNSIVEKEEAILITDVPTMVEGISIKKSSKLSIQF
jgi:hypothetical protein